MAVEASQSATASRQRVKNDQGTSTLLIPRKKRKAGDTKRAKKHIENLVLISNANDLPSSEFVQKYIQPLGSLLNYTPPLPAEPCDDKDTAKFQITFSASSDLSQLELNECFDILASTSAHAYQASSRGWKPKAKREEMLEKEMRYFLVRRQQPTKATPTEPETPSSTESNPILGFLSVMVTIEDDYPVLYIYEIHLVASARNHGLGGHLITIAEKVAKNVGVSKVMLTVFTSNASAERFYRRLGYEEDEFSPQPKRLRGGVVKRPDYIIMSKQVSEIE